MLKFFVVIPAYNNCQYLSGCLNSLLAQTYPTWSCVVVNDGSTDNTSEVAHRYAQTDARIAVVDLEANGGQHQARIEAMRHAEGDYVLFLDADDELAPYTMEELNRALAGGTYDVCHFGMKVLDYGAGPWACEHLEMEANRPADVMTGSDVLVKAFSYRGDFMQDWRITQRAYSLDLAKRAFERMAHERVEYAEDCYEAFVLADLTQRQLTFNEVKAYRYFYGRGANGRRPPMDLSLFEAIARKFVRCTEVLDAYAGVAECGNVALECANDMHRRLGLALVDDWFACLSDADRVPAVEVLVNTIGAQETAWNLMRLTRDGVNRVWEPGAPYTGEEPFNALWKEAERLAGAEPPADYVQLRDEVTLKVERLKHPPLVTVLVPVYNVERYLRHCLDSLLGQTLEDIQILCINDGSTDGSVQILEEYASKDSRIEIINKANSGYGASMNVGLYRARGKYVGILEPDDFADPAMFQELYELAERTGAEVVKSNYYEHVAGRPMQEDVLVHNVTERGKGPLGVAFSPREEPGVLLSSAAIWSGLYRKAFLTSNGIDFLQTPGASFQDTSFNLKALMAAQKVALTSRGYVHYRTDNPGSSVLSPSKVYYICDEYEEVWRFLDSRPVLFDTFKQCIPPIQFDGYQWNMERLARTHREAFFQRFFEEFTELNNRGLLSYGQFGSARWERVILLLNDPDRYFREYCGARHIHRTTWVELAGDFRVPGTDGIARLEDVLKACSSHEEVLVDDRNLSEEARDAVRGVVARHGNALLASGLCAQGEGFLRLADLRGETIRIEAVVGHERDVFAVRAAKSLAGSSAYKGVQSLVERLHGR